MIRFTIASHFERAGGTEISAGAYPASVTTDVVQITITARKLQ